MSVRIPISALLTYVAEIGKHDLWLEKYFGRKVPIYKRNTDLRNIYFFESRILTKLSISTCFNCSFLGQLQFQIPFSTIFFHSLPNTSFLHPKHSDIQSPLDLALKLAFQHDSDQKFRFLLGCMFEIFQIHYSRIL